MAADVQQPIMQCTGCKRYVEMMPSEIKKNRTNNKIKK